MKYASAKAIALTLAVSVPLTGCQQVQDFATKNPELFGGSIGALAGGGVGAAVGGKNHRTGGILIGAAAGALVGGGIGYAIRKSDEKKATDAQKQRAEADARTAREQMEKDNAAAAQKLQDKPNVQQIVPVARDEEKKQTTYVLVDPKSGVAGDDAYVFDDSESQKMLEDLDKKQVSQLDGQEVVFSPSSTALDSTN